MRERRLFLIGEGFLEGVGPGKRVPASREQRNCATHGVCLGRTSDSRSDIVPSAPPLPFMPPMMDETNRSTGGDRVHPCSCTWPAATSHGWFSVSRLGFFGGNDRHNLGRNTIVRAFHLGISKGVDLIGFDHRCLRGNLSIRGIPSFSRDTLRVSFNFFFFFFFYFFSWRK